MRYQTTIRPFSRVNKSSAKKKMEMEMKGKAVAVASPLPRQICVGSGVLLTRTLASYDTGELREKEKEKEWGEKGKESKESEESKGKERAAEIMSF
jgi:hypothetical protein